MACLEDNSTKSVYLKYEISIYNVMWHVMGIFSKRLEDNLFSHLLLSLCSRWHKGIDVEVEINYVLVNEVSEKYYVFM